MKKIVSKILAFIMAFSITTVFADRLPESVTCRELFGIESADSLTDMTIVSSNGMSAKISEADMTEWLNVYLTFSTFERVVSPLGDYTDRDNYYFILSFDNGIQRIVFDNSGVFSYTFGGGYEHDSTVMNNYICYIPYVGNARNTLLSANTRLYEKYILNGNAVNDTPQLELNLSSGLDVSGASAWAKPEVKKAAAFNLLPYHLTENYTSEITRKEFCELITRLIITEEFPYADSREGTRAAAMLSITREVGLDDEMDEVYYKDCEDDYISFLSVLGIIYGVGDGYFAPDKSLSREEAAVILWRTSKYLEREMPAANGDAHFDDNGDISNWAKDAVEVMKEISVMEGMGNNLFIPKGTYSREQAIATILRIFE